MIKFHRGISKLHLWENVCQTLHNGAQFVLVIYPRRAGQLLRDGLKSNFKILLHLIGRTQESHWNPHCKWLSYGLKLNTGPPVTEYNEDGSSSFLWNVGVMHCFPAQKTILIFISCQVFVWTHNRWFVENKEMTPRIFVSFHVVIVLVFIDNKESFAGNTTTGYRTS
jgi:hypothetical protein